MLLKLLPSMSLFLYVFMLYVFDTMYIILYVYIVPYITVLNYVHGIVKER